MKKLITYFLIVFSFSVHLSAQSLHIDSTWFLPTIRPNTVIQCAIPTLDKGVLFVGAMVLIPGGIIPPFPLDTVLENVMIGKIDSNHQVSWVKVYGGTQEDVAISACQTPDGGYAVLAGTNSNDGDVTGFKGGVDIWLLRIDGNGNLLWEKTYGSTQSDGPVSIANTQDHGFIILGSTNGSDGDVPFHYGSFFSMDWLVVKTDSIGNIQWSKDIGGTGDEAPYGAILPVDSVYYLASSSNSTDYDCSDTAWHEVINTNDDFHLLKLNSRGSVLWDSSYGGTGFDDVGKAFFDARDSTMMMIGNTASNDMMVTGYHGSGDLWVVKANKKGTLVWENSLGTEGPETGGGGCEAPNGGYMIFGAADYVIGGSDGWLSAINSSGNEFDHVIFGGIYNDNIYSFVPCSGGYAASGISGSPSFTEGINCNTNNSGSFISYFESWPLEVGSLENNENIFIYPNPADNKININIPHGQNGHLAISTIIGQVVYATPVTTKLELQTIDLQCWATGMYIIRWQGEDGSILTEKFIKD